MLLGNSNIKLWKILSVGEKPVPLQIFHHKSPQEMAWDRNGILHDDWPTLNRIESWHGSMTIGSNWLRMDTYTHITYSKGFHKQEYHSKELILRKASLMDLNLLWYFHKHSTLPAS